MEFVEDAGVSARNLNRPGMRYCLTELAQGRADVLIASAQTRLTRRATDWDYLVDTSYRQGWTLIALDVDFDTSTPEGEFMAGVMARVGHLQRRMIGKRTKAALAAKKANGIALGRPEQIDAETQARISPSTPRDTGSTRSPTGCRRDGVPTARGGPWRASTVQRVVQRQS